MKIPNDAQIVIDETAYKIDKRFGFVWRFGADGWRKSTKEPSELHDEMQRRVTGRK